MRISASAALLVAATSGVALALPGLAVAAETSAECTFDYNPKLSPGLTMDGAVGKVSSGGETGVVTCEGTVNGHEVTGPGTFGFEGSYGDGGKVSCTSGGTGNGFVLFTVPTAAGPQKVKDKISYGFGPAVGDPPLFGSWEGPLTQGDFVVFPTKGDCVTAPVEELRGTGAFEMGS